jgi:hypothetical protein
LNQAQIATPHFNSPKISLNQARIASPISILKTIVLNQAQMSSVNSILKTLVLNQAQISSLTSILKTNGLNQSKTILAQQDARMYTSSSSYDRFFSRGMELSRGGWSGIRGYCSEGFWPLEGFTSFSAISLLGLEEVRCWKLAFRG